MTTRLILVRHGMTEWNNEFRYQGHADINLNEEGFRQAEALREKLAGEKLAAVYSSDLSRAYNTAVVIVAPHGLPVQVCPDLREINFGAWEGLTYYDIEKNYPEQLKIWRQTPHLLQVPEGETFPLIRDKACACAEKIIAKHMDETVLIVTHGGTIAAMICGLLGQPLEKMWEYKQKNTAVNVLRWEEGRFRLDVLNDVSHLQPQPDIK